MYDTNVVIFLLVCLFSPILGQFWTQEITLCFNSSFGVINASSYNWPDLNGRSVIGLKITSSQENTLTCNDSIPYNWGCDNQEFTLFVHYGGILVAPDSTVDPTITYSSDSSYTIAQIPTTNPFLVYSTNFLFDAQNALTFDFGTPEAYVLSGYLCVSIQLMLSEYQIVASLGIGNTTHFSIPNELNCSVATGFQFMHVNGSISCKDTQGTYYWGCPQGLNIFVVSELFTSAATILVPDGYETRIPSSLDYWYNAAGATVSNKQIQIAANSTLNSSGSYFVVYGDQMWGSDDVLEGSITASVGISIVPWRFLSDGCFGAQNHMFGYVSIPSDLFNRQSIAFRLTYLNGSVNCGSNRNNTFWGCDTDNGRLILVMLNENTNPVDESLVIFPSAEDPTVWVIPKHGGSINVLGKNPNSTHLIFNTNYVFKESVPTLIIAYKDDLYNYSPEDNFGLTCFNLDVLLEEQQLPTPGPTLTPIPTPTPSDCRAEDLCCSGGFPQLSSVVCRPSVGLCDLPEYCDGKSLSCPPDVLLPPYTICRNASGGCDVPEVCGVNSSGQCPPDINETLDACGVCGGDGRACLANGKCGDLYCDTDRGENCTTCILDCPPCESPPTCGQCANGACMDGLCVCAPGWVGSLCDSVALNVTPIFDYHQPQIRMRTSTTGDAFISFLKIEEISSANQIIRSIDLQALNYSIWDTSENGLHWQYGAAQGPIYILLSFQLPNSSGIITFANQSVSLSPLSLKSTITIVNWPFESIYNQLRIWSTFADENMQGKWEQGLNGQNGNVAWVKYQQNHTCLFATFEDRIELDGKARSMQVGTNAALKSVFFVVPHFWSIAVLDPNYSVLLNEGHENGMSSRHKVPVMEISVGVVLSVVALVLIASVIYVKYYRKRKFHHSLVSKISG